MIKHPYNKYRWMQHTHDCDCCRALGRYRCDDSGLAFDLYACNDGPSVEVDGHWQTPAETVLIARYGPRPSENKSMRLKDCPIVVALGSRAIGHAYLGAPWDMWREAARRFRVCL
jgi:hypothetical protein